MRRFLSRRPDPQRRFVELLEHAQATADPSSLDHATVDEQLAMWGQFLQMQAWWLISDRGLPSVFDIGGVPTGMAAFDEPAASLPEGIRVDFHGAMPPEGALENFRRVGSEVGIKPIHLAGFTRAATS